MSHNIPDDIKELITKSLKGKISQEENELLQLWYNHPIANRLMWDGDDISEADLKNRLFNKIKDSTSKPKLKFLSFSSIAFKVAASIMIVFGIGYGIFRSNRSNQTFRNGTQNNVKKVILPDSTIVWLKGNSNLSYPKTFANDIREVTLDGEALFEVAKNKEKPFVILSGKYQTRVLGTSFNISSKNRHYSLFVLTGRVQVSRYNSSNRTLKALAVITPNQGFTADADIANTYATNEETKRLSVLKGTEYSMKFAHTPFKLILDKIAAKFNVSFTDVELQKYESCNITADLTDQSLTNSLTILCGAVGAKYQLENQIIKIEGGGCE